MIDTDDGTVALPYQKHLELLLLFSISATQLCMGQNELERLVGKIRSTLLIFPGAVIHL